MEPGRTNVTYVRNPGFLERVGGSLVGILVGLVLLTVASCLLFWNEGRAVQTAKSLDEGMFLTVPLTNPDVVSMENQGKLVHLTSSLNTDMVLSDSDYGVAVHDGYFFHGMDPIHPQVGDVRVKFEYAGISGRTSLGPPSVVSIIARQLGSKLMPYQTQSGDVLELLYSGRLTIKEIFAKEKMNNTMMTWAIRFGGWLLMFIGFGMLTSIITTLVDWVPIVREVVGMGVLVMNASFSISLSLTIIALGWIYYRPVMAIVILAMAASPFILSFFRSSGQRGYSRSRVD